MQTARPLPCAHPRPAPGCVWCRLAQADPRYGRLFGVEPRPAGARAPAARELPCVHLGAATGGTVVCPSCRGGTELKLFACATHGVCTPTTKQAPGTACCATCPDYAPAAFAGIPANAAGAPFARFDERNLWPGVPGKRFNASLLAYEGGYLLAARNGWAGSEVYLGRLDQDFRPVGPPWRLELRQRDGSAYGAEDPYLFVFRGQVHVGYVGVEGGATIRRTNVLYARLSRDELQVEERFFPQYAARRSWEKSWMPFEHRGELYFVYTVNPHRVLHVDGEKVRQAHNMPGPSPWRPGTDIRGGAPPVRVGGEWWHWFHSRWERPKRRYFMGLYTFGTEPPFRPLRIIPDPVIEADPTTNVGPNANYCHVFFPRGAVRVGNQWVISAGIHDRYTEFHRLDHASIEARLVPVGG